jgi:hypothetical protein
MDEAGLKFKLQAVSSLVPYIRLVERERLRARFDTAEEYDEYFRSEEVNRLFRELIVEKLAIGQVLALLRESPRSTGEISELLGMDSSEVSRYLNISARHGYSRFDESRKRFVTV